MHTLARSFVASLVRSLALSPAGALALLAIASTSTAHAHAAAPVAPAAAVAPVVAPAAAPQALPQTGTLLKDIWPGVGTLKPGSYSTVLLELPTWTLFSNTQGADEEPWRTDGTSAGTYQLANLNPVYSSLQLQHTGPRAAALGSLAIFAANDPQFNYEIHRSDGTSAGTQLIVDLHPTSGSGARYFVTFGSYVYFIARQDQAYHVFRTDGTAAGTTLAIDLESTYGTDLYYGALVVAEGRLWIWDSSFSGSGATRLFVSDGTTAGTRFVRAFNGAFKEQSSSLGVGFGGKLCFGISASFASDRGVWVSDGTAAGTQQLVVDKGALWITRTSTRLVFMTGDGQAPLSSASLYASDATLAGTTPLKPPGLMHVTSTPNASFEPARVGDSILFPASFSAPAIEHELYRTDGTIAGTYKLIDLEPGVGSSLPEHLRAHGAYVYFTATTFATGRELWRTDGTAAGTQLCHEWNPGVAWTEFGYDPGFYSTPNGFVLDVDDGVHGIEAWVVPDVGATHLLENFSVEPPGTSKISNVARLDTRVVFSADDGVHGAEPWISDGTASGTQMIADTVPGPSGGAPAALVTRDGRAYFVGGPDGDRELWISDGSAAGTHELFDVHAEYGVAPEQLLVADEQVFFVAHNTQLGWELWRTDGTAAGTHVTLDLYVATPDPNPSLSASWQPKLIAAIDDRVLFIARSGSFPGPVDVEQGLFVSDGTAAGTQLVYDFSGMPQIPVAPNYSAGFGSRVAFIVSTPALGYELWVSDGTSAGTHALVDLNPGAAGAFPNYVFGSGDRVYFWGLDGTATIQDLFVSDGTPSGTRKILNGASTGSGLTTEWSTSGATTWFRLIVSNQEHQIWRTNGKPNGTLLVDTYPLAVPWMPLPVSHELAGRVGQAGAQAYVKATAASGTELWLADAVGPGLQLTDTFAGTGNSLPRDVIRVGDRLLFVADDGVNGEELHAIPFDLVPAWDAANYGVGCSALANAPRIEAAGTFELGANAAIELESAARNSFGALYWSAAPASIGLGGGCTLLIDAPSLLGVAATSVQGTASKSFTLPNDASLVGPPLYFQWAVVESGGPLFGIAALSDALEVVIAN